VIELDGTPVGFIGELHPKWRQAYELPQAPVVFELDLVALQRRPVPQYEPIPRQQAALRDLAVVVSEQASHDALVAAIHDTDALVRGVTLFDIYKPAKPTPEIGPGEHSMAFRLELLDDQATLTDERIDAVIAAVVERLKAAFGARLRG
jgi:phenylalanyl-tRNA synthetase beta chain